MSPGCAAAIAPSFLERLTVSSAWLMSRTTPPLVRAGSIALLLLAYPWIVIAIYPIVGGPAMILGVVPVAAAGLLLGVRGGFAAIAAVVTIDYFLVRKLFVIQPDSIWGPALASSAAYSVLTLVMGTARRLWLRLGEVNRSLNEANRSLNEANRSLAEEARLRGEMAAQLQATAELHSSLLNSMGEGVGLFDADDRFVYANAAAEQLFTVAPGQLVGKCLRDVVAAEALEQLERARAAQPGQVIAYEILTRPSAAEPRHLLVTETLLKPSSATTAPVLRVMHDFTIRDRLEREQRELAAQVQRAQAVQSLGVLAGGVAHDFNNLLTGVLGNAELALLRLERCSPEGVRRALSEIQDFAREAAALAKQMLAYAGKGTLAMEAVSLDEAAREALRLVHSTVAMHACLEQDISTTLPNIRGDRTQLRQVLVNLIMNAVEALGDQRGTVRLSIQSQFLGPDQLQGCWRPERPQAGQYVVVTVSDSGQGISESSISRIFEPFFSTKTAGRGMGLAATLGIVRAHGGSISVESTEGRGSTFRVLLPPESRPVDRRVTLTVTEQPVHGHGSILVIDDERAVRSTTLQMLEELGYRVLLADGGREGLKLLALEPAAIRLALLDLTMPEMDGRDTLEEMRRAGHSIPVLLMSGYHYGDVAPLLQGSGVVGFLQKPLQLEQLARAVSGALAPQITTGTPAESVQRAET